MTTPQPTVIPKVPKPKYGFSDYSERLNGRAAMIGFVALVAIEYFTGKAFLTLLGIK
ncbi:MAG: hypothetical protein NZ772_07000 [Cyanobacteria bacterium]|nr:hypothetical protein [Cyanobacteriota bacterium]MDW8201254.1 hypothetical protein [Cyanobacteriota bacterium SKYGB_h_bin112]